MALTHIALDTNIAIEILNNNQKVIDEVYSFDEIYLPITVCGELLYGAMNSQGRSGNLLRLEKIINECKILLAERAVASEYARIKYHLQKIGRPIPENDIWIAATCISNHIPLCTRDKHFTNIVNLQQACLRI